MGVLTDGKKKITIFAESEEESIENTVAQYPVQAGNLVTDHTQRSSFDWTFEGKLFGKDHNEINNQWSQLISWQYSGTLLQWDGAIHHGNLMLSNITKTYDEGGFKNALKVNIELKEVHTVSTSFVKVQHVGPVAPKPA